MLKTSFRSLFAFVFLSACSTGILRLPASLKAQYDPTKTKVLREIAKQGIMFQFDEDFFRDIPGSTISISCQSYDEKKWSEGFFNLLNVFEDNPSLYRKVHVIYIRRGEKAGVEVNEDKEDGSWAQGKYLTVTYEKTNHQEKASKEDALKCDPNFEKLPQTTTTDLKWPTTDEVLRLLQRQPDKRKISRFDFDPGFLVYLANRMTIARLNSAWAWEKSLNGQEILPETLNRLAEQVRTGKFDHVNYWLDQIDQNSRLGRQIKFFSVLQDQKLAHGVAVDGVSGTRILATAGQQLSSTYLFISYRSRNGEYQFSTLTDLNSCLKKFDPNGTSVYWQKSERYLHPGYSCDQD